jgi:hypothetical protein
MKMAHVFVVVEWDRASNPAVSNGRAVTPEVGEGGPRPVVYFTESAK